MSRAMHPDDIPRKNRGFLGCDSSALPPRDRQVSDYLPAYLPIYPHCAMPGLTKTCINAP